MKSSTLENKFALVWRALGGPKLEREVVFHPVRKWRFDFAHPETRVAIEIQGGTFGRGRHSRHAGIKGDCEKFNAALLEGWSVFLLTGDMINVQNLTPIHGFIAEMRKS
jgi:very-short-patch-repair endonuclease